jgi:hypothetical protein
MNPYEKALRDFIKFLGSSVHQMKDLDKGDILIGFHTALMDNGIQVVDKPDGTQEVYSLKK